jgi:hypothetical protein
MHTLTLDTTAEGRPRKRFQRINTENDDPVRKPALPFQRVRDTQPHDPKINSHARRRSTLRDNSRPLLGPRPLESKRYVWSVLICSCGQCGNLSLCVYMLISIVQSNKRDTCRCTSYCATVVPSHLHQRQRLQPSLQLLQTAREQPEQRKHRLTRFPSFCQF